MATVMRVLFGFLVGVLVGAGGAIYLVQSDAGNLLVRRTDVVQDLERRLREMELQRDELNRQLERVIERSGRMEQAFTDLERRFRGLADDRAPQPVPPAPPATAP
jgi:hypothetical protein